MEPLQREFLLNPYNLNLYKFRLTIIFSRYSRKLYLFFFWAFYRVNIIGEKKVFATVNYKYLNLYIWPASGGFLFLN